MENTINPNIFGVEHNCIEATRKAHQLPDGSWRNALGYESTAEHRLVAKVWQGKCKHVRQVILDIGDREARQHDFIASVDELKLDNDLRLGGARFTTHGIATLARYIGLPSVATAFLVERNYHFELADIINRELRSLKSREGERNFLVRTTMDSDPRINAVMSQSFTPVDHGEVVERVCRALPQNGTGSLATQFSDDDDSGNLILNLLLPDSFKDYGLDDLGVGLSISNGRYGLSKLELTPYIFRGICFNGTRWGWRESNLGLRQKHSGVIDRDRLQADIDRAVRIGLSGGNDLLAVMGYSRQVIVADPIRVIASISQDRKLSTEQARAWMGGYNEEPESTAFGVVGGLTRGAQRLAPGIRNQLEQVAGGILTPSLSADMNEVKRFWERTIDRARLVGDDVIERITASA